MIFHDFFHKLKLTSQCVFQQKFQPKSKESVRIYPKIVENMSVKYLYMHKGPTNTKPDPWFFQSTFNFEPITIIHSAGDTPPTTSRPSSQPTLAWHVAPGRLLFRPRSELACVVLPELLKLPLKRAVSRNHSTPHKSQPMLIFP